METQHHRTGIQGRAEKIVCKLRTYCFVVLLQKEDDNMKNSEASLLKPLLLAVSVVVFTIVRLNRFRTGKKTEKNSEKNIKKSVDKHFSL